MAICQNGRGDFTNRPRAVQPSQPYKQGLQEPDPQHAVKRMGIKEYIRNKKEQQLAHASVTHANRWTARLEDGEVRDPRQSVSDEHLQSSIEDIDRSFPLPAFSSPRADLLPDSKALMAKKTENLRELRQKRVLAHTARETEGRRKWLGKLGSRFLAGFVRAPIKKEPPSPNYVPRQPSPEVASAGKPEEDDLYDDDTTVMFNVTDIPTGTQVITPKLFKQLVTKGSGRRNAQFLCDQLKARQDLITSLNKVNGAIESCDLVTIDGILEKSAGN